MKAAKCLLFEGPTICAQAIWCEVHAVLDDTATSRRQYAVFITLFLGVLFT